MTKHFRGSLNKDTGNRKQPATKEAQDNGEKRTVLTKLHPLPLSDEALAAMRIRALRLERKAKSPRILITHQGDQFLLLLDEGSELDCGDGDYFKKKGTKIVPSQHSAKAAGNKALTILGVTEDDIIVDTMFGSTHVPINMGKVTVVENLGVPLLLGEPGKAFNKICTDPKNRMVFLEQEGRYFSKPYYERKERQVEVCRVEEGPVTIYPGQSIKITVPETFIDKNIMITPRNEMRRKFHEGNQRYRRVFTKTPGRYSGAFGDSDTSLRFNSKPVQTRKVSTPNYSPTPLLKWQSGKFFDPRTGILHIVRDP